MTQRPLSEVALWGANAMKTVFLTYGSTHGDHHQLHAELVDKYGGVQHLRELTSEVIERVLDAAQAGGDEAYARILTRLDVVEEMNGGITEAGKVSVRACIAFLALVVRFPGEAEEERYEDLFSPMMEWLEQMAILNDRGEWKQAEQ